MSEQHTPGPWSAKWSKYREKVFIVQAGQPSNRVLARFDGDGEGPDKQSIADARLIAAAPDMVAALKRVIDVATTSPPVELVRRLDAAIRICAEAYAKATGGEAAE